MLQYFDLDSWYKDNDNHPQFLYKQEVNFTKTIVVVQALKPNHSECLSHNALDFANPARNHLLGR